MTIHVKDYFVLRTRFFCRCADHSETASDSMALDRIRHWQRNCPAIGRGSFRIRTDKPCDPAMIAWRPAGGRRNNKTGQAAPAGKPAGGFTITQD